MTESLSMVPQEVAVPVFDGAGRTAAALAASLPTGAAQERIDEIVGHLTHAASAAGRTLGHG
jgi:DNA-binding IclR family transcriptional regulator